jgi:ribosomal protein L7/L12
MLYVGRANRGSLFRPPPGECRAELDARLRRKEELLALPQAGRKVAPIMVYREDTGAGLKEAKDAIEALQRRLRGRDAH